MGKKIAAERRLLAARDRGVAQLEAGAGLPLEDLATLAHAHQLAARPSLII